MDGEILSTGTNSAQLCKVIIFPVLYCIVHPDWTPRQCHEKCCLVQGLVEGSVISEAMLHLLNQLLTASKMRAQLTCSQVYCIFRLKHGNKLRCSVHLQPSRLTHEGQLNDACL